MSLIDIIHRLFMEDGFIHRSLLNSWGPFNCCTSIKVFDKHFELKATTTEARILSSILIGVGTLC